MTHVSLLSSAAAKSTIYYVCARTYMYYVAPKQKHHVRNDRQIVSLKKAILYIDKCLKSI